METGDLQSLLQRLRMERLRPDIVSGRLVVHAEPGRAVDPSVARLIQRNEAALVDFIQVARSARSLAGPRPERHADEPVPVTSAQRGILFVDSLHEGAGLFNIVTETTIDGPLRAAAFREALRRIFQRHRILCAELVETADASRWLAGSPPAVPLSVIDLSGLGDAQERTCEALAARERRFVFPRHGPWLRALLLRLSARRWKLILNRHHVVSDGWSFAILTRDLETFYRADISGEALQPTPPAGDFFDYCRDRTTQQRGQRDLAYWASRLAGAAKRIDLPWTPASPCETDVGVRTLSVDPDFTAWAARLQMTSFAALLAAFALLLGRWSGQSALPVGIDVTCRDRPEWCATVGHFVNRVVLLLRVDPNWAMRHYLHEVQSVATEAIEHRHAPFADVVRDVRTGGSAASLFNVMFGFHNNPHHVLDLPDLCCRTKASAGGPSDLDLSLYFTNWASGTVGELKYRRSFLDDDTAARFADEFGAVLRRLPLEENTTVEPFLRPIGTADDEQADAWSAAQAPTSIDHIVGGRDGT